MRHLNKLFFSLFCACLLPVAGFTQPQENQVVSVEYSTQDQMEQKIDRLLELIQMKLERAQKVAEYKWHHTETINEPEMNQERLEAVKENFQNEHIIEMLLSLIDAEKCVMIQTFENYAKKNISIDPKKAKLKPEIKDLDLQILHQVEALASLLKDQNFQDILKHRSALILKGFSITDEARQIVLNPLL